MLWPLAIPVQITFCLLMVLISLLTLCAPWARWKRGRVFAVSALVGCFVFIPACTGIMSIVDARRFGVFQYATFADIDDVRVQRYLPTTARNITLEKIGHGSSREVLHFESDLRAHLDEQWARSGKHSTIPRDKIGDGRIASAESLARLFGDLGWPIPESANEWHTPVGGNGAGATYYHDPTTGTAFHWAGYW